MKVEDYGAKRDALLARIVAALSADERFVAAWLAGSHGRGTADAVSDLDLTLVVTDAQRDSLCARPWMVGAGTNARRLAVFQLFGEPAVIHENHFNAPPGGTFTFTLYAGTALIVDWVFVPLSDARRPAEARVLFAHADIPPQTPEPAETLPQRVERASERLSFFWMMAAVAAKYRARGDAAGFHAVLDMLHSVTNEIAALTAGAAYRRARQPLATTPAEQAAALRAVCDQALALAPTVLDLGGHAPPDPMPAVEILLSLE